jgi:hypothetical protein
VVDRRFVVTRSRCRWRCGPVDRSMRPRRRSFFVSSGKLPSHILTIWMAQVVQDHQGIVPSTAGRGQVGGQPVCVVGVYQRVRMMVAIPDQVSQLACAPIASNGLGVIPQLAGTVSQAVTGSRLADLVAELSAGRYGLLTQVDSRWISPILREYQPTTFRARPCPARLQPSLPQLAAHVTIRRTLLPSQRSPWPRPEARTGGSAQRTCRFERRRSRHRHPEAHGRCPAHP